MPGTTIDFKGLNADLLTRSLDLVSAWLPGGRVRGREYVCGSLRGEQGDSLSVNLNTGMWADFAGDAKGGDLISLFAAIENISQGEAFRRLSSDQGYEISEKPDLPPPPPPDPEVCMPPADASECDCVHPHFGTPSKVWKYLSEEKALMFYIARYDSESGKQIAPWSWSDEKGWVCKGWPAPRPLYGLELLADNPGRAVLLVEGEKACDAARELLGDKYCVLTWPNGAKAYKKADFSPLFGRRILLWPDMDEPGREAMLGIAEILQENVPQIKILDDKEMPEGWDAADALNDGWEAEQTIAWAKSHVHIFHDASAVAVVEPEPEPEPVPVIAKEAHIEQAQVIAETAYINDDQPSELSQGAVYWAEKLGLPMTKNGNVIIHLNSAIRALEAYPEWKDFIWFDDFQQKIFTTWKLLPNQKFREWEDSDTLELQDFMIYNFGMNKLSKELLYDALAVVAKRQRRNGPKEYFESLTWDGEPRIEMFFHNYFMANDSDYCRAASKNWWITMAARIYRPGCKVDNMVMLEGGQGKFKSTALNVIGGEWYTEAHGQVTDSNFYYQMQGKLIVEFADLDGISKAEANAIKKFITCKVDRYRAVWARSAKDFPRQCIFVGTTNEDEYLKDNTGARRFWPIKTFKIELEKIKEDRDQLFAEAVHRYKAGETWWEMPQQAVEEQERRRLSDEWEYIIDQYLMHKSETTITDIAVEALKLDVARMDMLVQRRIGKVLRLLKWDKFFIFKDGKQQNVWRSTKYYDEPDY